MTITSVNDQTIAPESYVELLESFQIRRSRRNHLCGGQWVEGTMGDHAFEALVFSEHAEFPSYELAESRISKLWVSDPKRRVVASFDRGWNRAPKTPIADALVDALSGGLAEAVFGR